MKVVQKIIEAIDSNKPLPDVSLLDAMKMLVLAWDEVTDTIVQNCFRKAGFSKVAEEDAILDDPFAALKSTLKELVDLDETYKDITVEDVSSFDDMLVSTQEPLSGEEIIAEFFSIDADAQQGEFDEDDS